MQQNQALRGESLAAFGAGVLCALMLPRFLIGWMGAALLIAAGCCLSRAQNT